MVNVDVLKVPLGFIKLVELLLAIIAFASVANFSREFQYKSMKSTSCSLVTRSFSYPFDLKSDLGFVPKDSCATTQNPSGTIAFSNEDYSSSSKFFMFTGVTAFLYVIAALLIYLFAWPRYESDNRFPIADLFITGFFALFWLFATIVWSVAASGIGGQAGPSNVLEAVMKNDAACSDSTKSCQLNPESWGFGGLIVGALAAFACLILFVSNVWFVYKETVYFRNKSAPPRGAPPVPEGPRVDFQ